MALSTATLTLFPYPKGVDNTQRNQILRGTVALSAGTYPPGGYSLSWVTLTNASGERIESIPNPASTPSSTGSPFPTEVDFYSVGYQSSGYVYVWDNVQGNFHVFISANAASGTSGPLIEGVAPNTAVLPAALLADSIQFCATFPRN